MNENLIVCIIAGFPIKAFGNDRWRRQKKSCIANTIQLYKNKKSWQNLLSHTIAHAVPSVTLGLTTLFGMGRGVTPKSNHQENLYPENKFSGLIKTRCLFAIVSI